MLYVLKIKKEFAYEILEGKKLFEIRKINKAYIGLGDTILFVDLENNKPILTAYVCDSQKFLQSDINYFACKHQMTLDFVEKNYKDEIELFFITLKYPIKFSELIKGNN